MLDRRTLLAAAAATAAVSVPTLAQGAWPERPVRVVVPWPPGGSTDVLARLLSERLSQSLGQPFVVENKPGAGGNIGTDAIAKAAPDGYTMGPVTVGGWSINQYLYTRLPYDPERDIVPVSMHWELPERLRRAGAARAGAHAAGVRRLGEAAARRRELRQPGRGHHAPPLGRHVRLPRGARRHPCAVPRRGADHPGDAVRGRHSSPSTTSPATSR